MKNLGMYVHTHWGYRRPYSARTWTLADWRGYLTGLKELGFDLVLFWPLIDTMPAEPTASDRAFLEQTARVIQMARREFGMRFWFTAGVNLLANDRAAEYSYETRPYFTCEHKVDPRDPAAVKRMLAIRRGLYAPLREADGVVMIDSDPGGYIDSTNAEFVDLLAQHIGVFREFNPQAELIHWMWVGWENYNRFWKEARAGGEGHAEPVMRVDYRPFVETLKLIQQRIPEPWSLFTCWPEHVRATNELGLVDRRLYAPYGAMESEPSFPLTLVNPTFVEDGVHRYGDEPFPRGLMGNAQTHCLQLPHTYLCAHYAHGGTSRNADLAGFAENLLPGLGGLIAEAWGALRAGTPETQRAGAARVRQVIGRAHRTGNLAGLLFGDPNRFLLDLAQNLDVRADLADLDAATAAGPSPAASAAVQAVLNSLTPYQERVGYEDAYLDPMHKLLNEPLERLNDPEINRVLGQFHDWRNPAVRHGVVPRLLAAMRAHVAAPH